MRGRSHVAVTLAASLALTAHVNAQNGAPLPATPLRIEARDIATFNRQDPKQRRFGELEFIGGAVLSATAKEFGGISGLLIQPDGESFIAHSDRGHWFRGKFQLDGDRITGITNAEMAPMRGPRGTLSAMGWFDTEALTSDGHTLYVGIERKNLILRFNAFGGVGTPLPVSREISNLPNNKGLEALAFVPRGMPLGGGLIAIAERASEPDGNIRAFILSDGKWSNFTIRRRGKFDVSDAAISPTGHLVILERYFTLLSGVHLRMRAIPLADIAVNALVDGKVLIEADGNFEIDNMEALAITRNSHGGLILTLISDDNFNFLQRTIVLRFHWPQ